MFISDPAAWETASRLVTFAKPVAVTARRTLSANLQNSITFDCNLHYAVWVVLTERTCDNLWKTALRFRTCYNFPAFTGHA